jgi:hypothetical protein
MPSVSIASHSAPGPCSKLSHTNKRGVHTFGFCSGRSLPPGFGSTAGDPRRYLRHWKKVLPCKKEHISMWVTTRSNINPSGTECSRDIQLTEKSEVGSPGRIRTYSLSVNSRGGQKSKCPIWCRLQEIGSHFSYSNCTQSCTQKVL